MKGFCAVKSMAGATIGILMLTHGVACAVSDPVKQCQEAKLKAAHARAECLADERLGKLHDKVANPAKCEAPFDATVAKADPAAA